MYLDYQSCQISCGLKCKLEDLSKKNKVYHVTMTGFLMQTISFLYFIKYFIYTLL